MAFAYDVNVIMSALEKLSDEEIDMLGCPRWYFAIKADLELKKLRVRKTEEFIAEFRNAAMNNPSKFEKMKNEL